MVRRLRFSTLVALIGLAGAGSAAAQGIGPNCTASIMNRTVQVNANGTFAIPDVPVDQGSYRVRITCREADGTTRTFLSDFQNLVPNGANNVGTLAFGANQPIPTSIEVVALTTVLQARGETVQLSVRGVLPNGSPRDLTAPSSGTTYTTSNARIATVTPQGLVTAIGRGQAIISARNEGVLGSVIINVAVPNDADLDGIPDEYETANGLNPNDPNDATQDTDGDGLTNLQEYQLGTNAHAPDTDGDGLKDGEEGQRGTNALVPDTDGDGLTDGFEVKLGTNPLVADTDADGIADGIEVRLGTDPLNATATTTVQGRVVDNNGSPVNAASVFVLGLLTSQTDTVGAFAITNVPATLGAIQVLARLVRNNQLLDGTSAAIAPVSNGTTDVGTIQIAASAGVVTGIISTPGGPVAGAQVTLIQGPDLRVATTDITGRYRVANVQPGSIVLTARDPLSSLRGRTTGVVPVNDPLTLNLSLGAFGTVSGIVLQRDATTPVGAGVNVSLSGAALANSTTDGQGRFTFDFVPLSAFTVEASDVNGNRGRTNGTLTFTGETIVANVTFLAKGNVNGHVSDGSGAAVPNATVTLSDATIFGSTRTQTTDSQGNYAFNDIFIGQVYVSARSPLTGLGGQANGQLQTDGQSITLDITLQATGTISGDVHRAGSGGGVVPNAQVRLGNGSTMTADANGHFSFTLVPTGGQTITATDLATGDRGTTAVTVPANNTVQATVTLIGQAPVTVLVHDGAGANVSGAQVTVNDSQGSSYNGLTDADGLITFPRVFVGNFGASARNPNTQMTGSTNGAAVLGQTTQVTINLQAFGTINGTVFAADGSTPVPNADVRLSGPASRRLLTGADGRFAFATIPTGTYRLDVFDQYGNDRAFVNSCTLNAPQGNTQTCNLREVGVGTVTGTVRNPDGAIVPNVTVFLQGARSAGARTDVAGVYTVPGVPLGAFVVTASYRSGNQQLFGTAQGQIATDGETVHADINLSATLIPTTTTLHDANNFEYGLRENGSIQDGTRQFFGGDFGQNRGGALLDVIVNNTPTRFTGSAYGTSEINGRQVAITQQGIAGLDVTRKVYVPLAGYFARYLERFTNNSQSPITFGVSITSFSRYISKLQNGFLFNREPRIVSTSNGDAVVDVGASGDHWVVLDDDEDIDPFDTNSLPSVAHVFDGPGAQSPVDAATFDLASNFGKLTTRWNNLTLQPGESLAIMHFVSQETMRGAAQAGAQRLDQMPPEALGDSTIPEAITDLQQLQGSMTSLNENAQLVASYAASTKGPINTFAPTAQTISDLNGQIAPLVSTLETIAGDEGATVDQVRTAAQSAASLATQIRAAALSITRCEVYYFPGGNSFCGGAVLSDVVDYGLSGLLSIAKSTGDYAATLIGTASNVQDLTFVRNFALPLSGGSTVAPLPLLTGTITGQVFAADLTPLVGGSVTFNSGNALFRRRLSTTASQSFSIPDPTGANPAGTTVVGFRFQGRLQDGNSLPLPADAFTLQATHPRTYLASPVVSDNFPEDTSVVPSVRLGSINEDIRFTNSGQLAGVVRRANGAVASSGSVQITGGGLGVNGLTNVVSVPIGIDGSYSVNGLPGNTYTLLATLPEPQGSALSATEVASIVDGQTTQKNIVMPGTGGVSGIVRRGNGSVAPSIPVTLRGDGISRSTSTDTGGRYTFFDVLAEAVVVEAVDRATNTAAAGQTTVSADAVAPLDLTLTLGGTVTGLVRLGNQLVSGAQVTVAWSDGSTTVTTGNDGRYTVQHVTPGPVTVRAQNANGLGSNGGSLGLSGDTLTLDINLYAGGTVTGQVLAAVTAQPVPGVQVSINRYVPGLPNVVTTDAQGRFTFEAVSIGSFTLNATNPANGDRGTASNQVNANGETRTVNVTLNGTGQVTVTVRDASQNLINNAHVAVSTQSPFYQNSNGTTGPDGTVQIDNVLAGSLYVSATDPATNLSGSTTGTLAANGSTNLTVQLQAAGSILGRVFGPDGTTPATGVVVYLQTYYFSTLRSTTSASDGSFRFDAVPLGTYALAVYDGDSRLRARATGLVVSSNGQLVSQNLVLIGLGTVSGIVSMPNSTPSPNTSVSVRSLSSIGGYFTTVTNSDGSYSVLNVPVGGFIATAQTGQLIGEASGQITLDGQQVTANIQLQNNAINLPVYRYDGNNFYQEVRGDASIGDSTNSVYGGDFNTNYGAFLLDIYANGQQNRFTGGTIGTQEENGQEIAVRQQGLAGLDVTRKIFLPNAGYFTRWVEKLTNPTANPITVDVKITDNLRTYYDRPRVIVTSSGDATINVTDPNTPDQWVVMGDVYDRDPYVTGGVAETAFVFGDATAQHRADAAGFQLDANYYSGGALSYRWNSVTIPPGGTVAFMHFGSQETSRAGAQAAAQRLVQLPPEALDGLAGDEIAAIQNFTVPSGGISLLSRLDLGGTVNGTVFEWDGTTTVPSAYLTLQSNNAIFSRVYSTNANSAGGFSFTSVIQPSGNYGNTVIPIDAFTVTAQHPSSSAVKKTVAGSFQPGQTLAVRNVSFTGSAIISGTVRSSSGAAWTNSGYLRFYRSSPTSIDLYPSLANDGTYRVGGVPAGTYQVTVVGYHPQGTQLTTTTTLVVAGDQSLARDFTLPATGSVTGVVTTALGAVAPNIFMDLRTSQSNYSFYRSLYTNSSGQFTFPDVPAGTYYMEAQEPNTGVVTSASVTVTANSTTTQNLQLIGIGTVQITVLFQSGSAAPSSQVNIYEAARGSGGRFIGYTDGAGHVTAQFVALGNYTVRAYNPNNTTLYGETPGTLTTPGETQNVSVTVPGTGVLTGHIYRADGATAVSNSYIEVRDANTNAYYAYAYSDSAGLYTITQVPAGRSLRIRAYNPTNSNIYRDGTGTIPSDGATLTVNINMPAVANLRITTLRSDGTPFPSTRVDVRTALNGGFQFFGNTDANGVVTNANFLVPEGAFSVLARDPSTFATRGSVSGQVQAQDDNHVVDVTVNAPLSGNVTGTVYAGDGATPLSSAYVDAYDVVSGNYLGAQYTNSNGVYTINGITPGSDGARITAHSPNDYNTSVSQTVQFAVSGETKTADFTLPISVINGTVRFFDGTAVAYPTVFATYEQNGYTNVRYANVSNADGTYRLVGVPNGDFTITAQDYSSSLTGSVAGNLSSNALTVDVTLEPDGVVEGDVYDADGNLVPYASVALLVHGQSFTRYADAGQNGHYSFTRVPFGQAVVQACAYIVNTWLCGNAVGTIDSSNLGFLANVHLPGSGDLGGTVTDNGSPVAASYVTVRSLGIVGPETVEQSTYTDESGQYVFFGVQAGDVQVTADDPNNSGRQGVQTGTVVANQTTAIDVALGNSINLDYVFYLDGSDGFRYDMSCDGSLNDGGTTNRNLGDAFDGYLYLASPGGSPQFNCVSSGILELNSRQVVLGPQQLFGVQATRKVYVPETGGFARYLEILQNPTNTDLNVTFEIDGNLGSDGSTHIQVAPSATSNHYAVTTQNGYCCDPALAHVFGGPGAAVTPSAVFFQEGNDNPYHRWNITIPANGTAILLHFLVQRDYQDNGAAAEAQALTLVDLSDPHALDGLDNATRALIVNFAVPPLPPEPQPPQQ